MSKVTYEPAPEAGPDAAITFGLGDADPDTFTLRRGDEAVEIPPKFETALADYPDLRIDGVLVRERPDYKPPDPPPEPEPEPTLEERLDALTAKLDVLEQKVDVAIPVDAQLEQPK